MIRFSCFFFLLLSPFLYSQETKIIVIDSLNQTPIQEVVALDSAGQFLTKSNNDGVLLIKKSKNRVYVTANGYKQKMISLIDSETIICKINKIPEVLRDVVVGRKPKLAKYGNLNLNHGSFSTDSQTCRPTYKNLTCATKIITSKLINVTFYNFCIYEKTNNSPFNFQIYNDKDGKPDQVVYSQYVQNYKKGWNRIGIDNANLTLISGAYYIAMQWVPLEDKSDVWVAYKDKDRVLYAVGQTLGINQGDDNQLESFIYKDNWQKTPAIHTGKKGNYTQYIEAFEN